MLKIYKIKGIDKDERKKICTLKKAAMLQLRTFKIKKSSYAAYKNIFVD